MKMEVEPSSPSRDALQLVNECAQKISPDEPSLASWYENYSKWHTRRIAFDVDIVVRYVKHGTRILEFGSIPPMLTSSLSEKGFDITGVDICPGRFGSCIDALGLLIIQCNVENERTPFPDASFDAVIFNELFEHLRINIIFTLSEVLRVLKPGGTLFLSTPNLRSYVGLSNFLRRGIAYSCADSLFEEYTKISELGHMGHVREYSKQEVVLFLQKIGFDVQSTIYRGRYHSRTARYLLKLFPRLKPFISYIAKKPHPVD